MQFPIVHSVKEFIEKVEIIRNKNVFCHSLLFRGQGDSDWSIQSTLERSGIAEVSFAKYYHDIDYLKPEINSLGHKFERKIISSGYNYDFTEWWDISNSHLPDLEFLTYLRHHGFPTPLIDFSQSEFVALFFACESIGLKNDNGNVANAKVFVISDAFGCTFGSSEPMLCKIGHYIETDKRHIAQQSEYLISTEFRSGNPSEWYFIPFSSFMQQEQILEEAVVEQQGDSQQSFFEIEIAGECKENIMAELARMNINHYTLYLSEDALIQKLKYEFLRNYKK